MSKTPLNTIQNKLIRIATYVHNTNDISGKDTKKLVVFKKKRIFKGSLEIEGPLTLPIYMSICPRYYFPIEHELSSINQTRYLHERNDEQLNRIFSSR